MTNNDDLALKIKSAAMQRIESDSWDSAEGRIARIGLYKDTAEYLSPANILSLLAERDADKKRIADMQTIVDAAEKLVRCKGRYHSEQNYRALAALFGVTTPDIPPLETEARTVSVNAADIINVAEGKNHAPGRMIPIDTLGDYCAAAGIKLEVGG